MNVTGQIRNLERMGFSGYVLDHAVALAGSRRLVYEDLCRAVEERAMTPVEALRTVERTLEAAEP